MTRSMQFRENAPLPAARPIPPCPLPFAPRRPSAPVQLCAQLVITCWTIGGIPHIVFTRPQHLHWPADGLRNQSRFHSVIVLQPPPEAATRQRNVHFHLVGIKPNRLRYRVANILRNLSRRPQFAIR